MGIKQQLKSYIPDAYYSNGTKATCISFRIFNMFDIDSQSFKVVKKIKIMEELKISNSSTLECNKIILGGKYEISVQDGNLNIDEKK